MCVRIYVRTVTYSNLAFIASHSAPLETHTDHEENEEETAAFTSTANDVYNDGELHIFTNDSNTGRIMYKCIYIIFAYIILHSAVPRNIHHVHDIYI